MFDILVDLEPENDVFFIQNQRTVQILRTKLESAENEIEALRKSALEALSPISNVKVFEEDVNITSTPARTHVKSRNSSIDSFANRSADISARIKGRRAGNAISNLVSKIQSTRKGRGDYYG